jgi:hypothetical protein
MKPKWPEGFKRLPATELVDVSKLESSRTVFDQVFLKLYTRYLIGEIPVGYTRLRMDQIEINDLPGHVTPAEHVTGFAAAIQAGSRPTLYVYRSPNAGKESWVCSDDLPAAKAYLKLGLTWVPCAIFDPSDGGYENTCMVFRSIRESRHVYERFLSPAQPKIRRVRSERWKVEERNECIDTLTDRVRTVLAQLRLFHIEQEGQLHYHHTLASVLARTERILHAVNAVLAAGLPDQAVPLVRSAYELCLSVHFDWLNPERFGVHLQWHAALGQHELKKTWDEILANTPTGKRKREDSLRASFNKVQTFAAKVSPRASISPFAALHERSYRTFSAFSHQDFSTAAIFAGALGEDVDPSAMRFDNDDGLTMFLLRWLDMCVTSICAWTASDVGIA